MAREHKYRGRRTNDGQWIYGFFCQWQSRSYICPDPNESGFHGGQIMRFEIDGWFLVDPTTVGESTGIKDKDGKEIIYEGDKVEFWISAPWDEQIPVKVKGEVCWESDGFWVRSYDGLSRLSDWDELEVIGSIHDKETPQ